MHTDLAPHPPLYISLVPVPAVSLNLLLNSPRLRFLRTSLHRSHFCPVSCDARSFTPNQPLLPGTLYVSEQIPGLYVSTDQTQTLLDGYWPSYNVAFHPEIYNLSGCSCVRCRCRCQGIGRPTP